VQSSSFLSYAFQPRALPTNPQDIVDFLGPKALNPQIEHNYKSLKEECISAPSAQVSRDQLDEYNSIVDYAARKFADAVRKLDREEEEEDEEEGDEGMDTGR